MNFHFNPHDQNLQRLKAAIRAWAVDVYGPAIEPGLERFSEQMALTISEVVRMTVKGRVA